MMSNVTLQINLIWENKLCEDLIKCYCCEDIIFLTQWVPCTYIENKKSMEFIDMSLCQSCGNGINELNDRDE